MLCLVLGCHIFANSSLLGEDVGNGTFSFFSSVSVDDFSSGIFSSGFSASFSFSSLGTASTDSCKVSR